MQSLYSKQYPLPPNQPFPTQVYILTTLTRFAYRHAETQIQTQLKNNIQLLMETSKRRTTTAIEFPTSPQLNLGEEIIHLDHHHHPLSKINFPDLFTCSGCKEYGAGKRFTCPQCNFQLHEFCGLAPQELKGHPFHCQHPINFHPKPGKSVTFSIRWSLIKLLYIVIYHYLF